MQVTFAIIGLSLSNLSYNIQLRKSNEIIKDQYLKLQESEKLKEEFINIAAHELRNPIQPILGLSTILLREIKDKLNKEYLESILNNSKRLNTFIENMLDVTKIHNNILKINKEILEYIAITNNKRIHSTNNLTRKNNIF